MCRTSHVAGRAASVKLVYLFAFIKQIAHFIPLHKFFYKLISKFFKIKRILNFGLNSKLKANGFVKLMAVGCG